MDKREVSRIIRMSDIAKASADERARRYQAECRTIDMIAQGAKDG